MQIKNIPITERPRERMIEYGSTNLSNIELLSIILRQGVRNKSVKDISAEIINCIGSIEKLKNISFDKLKSIDGIGNAQALTILACLELGKRVYLKKNSLNISFTNSKDIYEYMKYLLDDKKQEYFYCIYVNNKKEMIERKLLFMGTINRSTVHPREVFKNAFLCSASGIICIHNHPSGDTTPSKEDIFFTNSLVEIGSVTCIPIIDHLIIGNDNYYSFFDNGKITNL